MRQFLVGLLTHHLVTKLVSLLLAIVLFVFVQQSISETQRIERLVIQFRLDPELDKTKVLLQDEVVLKDVTVRGLRESLTREMAALRSKEGFRIVKEINAEFLRRHEQEGGIPIDVAFCRTEGIPWQLGRDFELKIEDPPTLTIEPRVNRTLRPTLSDAMRERLQLPEGFKFVVTGEPVFQEPRAISISGPPSGVPGADADNVLPLYINVRLLRQDLDKIDTEQEANAGLVVEGIDWEKSGFKSGLLRFVYVEQPSVSRDYLKFELVYRCPVEIRRERIPHVVVPLNFRTDTKHIGLDQLRDKKYEYAGANGLFATKPKIDAQFDAVEIDLEVTPGWKERKEEISRFLVLEIDFTATEEVAGRIEAPIALRATRDAPATILSEVRLARGTSNAPESFLFQKKK